MTRELSGGPGTQKPGPVNGAPEWSAAAGAGHTTSPCRCPRVFCSGYITSHFSTPTGASVGRPSARNPLRLMNFCCYYCLSLSPRFVAPPCGPLPTALRALHVLGLGAWPTSLADPQGQGRRSARRAGLPLRARAVGSSRGQLSARGRDMCSSARPGAPELDTPHAPSPRHRFCLQLDFGLGSLQHEAPGADAGHAAAHGASHPR